MTPTGAASDASSTTPGPGTAASRRAGSPRAVLFGAGEALPDLPVCDHYSGVEPRMTKSLQLQAQMGPVFDVTLDNEDGAPVGGEVEHAHLIAGLLAGPDNRHARVGVRLLPYAHPRFAEVVDVILRASRRPAYLMLPKSDRLQDVEDAAAAIDAAGGSSVPLHALIETHGALRDVFAIATHPRIESLSFGLMDFVSAHRGAIPLHAMTAEGQFEHPLVVRAKIEIAAACHAVGKTPAHGVVTELKNPKAMQAAAEQACRRLGFTRMWSIHPAQIQPIIDAFSPTAAEVDQALEIICAAEDAHWAPTRHRDTLHDRASYRYFWEVIERAHRTAPTQAVPAELRAAWFG